MTQAMPDVTKMKLIDQPHAPNPRRVNIFLAEKGISIPSEVLNIPKKEHRTDTIAKLNPLRTLPILIFEDGSALAESVAICRYFEELQPDPPLMGTTPLEKATIEMWNRRAELQMLGPMAACFRHLHPAMAELEVPQVPAWGEANRDRAIEGMRLLNDQLASHAYIAGETFTIADITALCAIDMKKMARIEIPDELTHLLRWHDLVSSRPSARAGM